MKPDSAIAARERKGCKGNPAPSLATAISFAGAFLALLGGQSAGLHAAEFLAAAAKPTGPVETHINSKSVNFDLKSRTAIYSGGVQVEDPRVNMTCELLTARLPATGNRIDSIVAETNVVIFMVDKGATNRATADKAVYTYAIDAGVTNEVLELTGSPVIETAQGRMTGTKIIWDRAKENISAENPRMLMISTPASSTNAPATNAVVEPKPANP